jgi:hypothetical protein
MACDAHQMWSPDVVWGLSDAKGAGINAVLEFDVPDSLLVSDVWFFSCLTKHK